MLASLISGWRQDQRPDVRTSLAEPKREQPQDASLGFWSRRASMTEEVGTLLSQS